MITGGKRNRGRGPLRTILVVIVTAAAVFFIINNSDFFPRLAGVRRGEPQPALDFSPAKPVEEARIPDKESGPAVIGSVEIRDILVRLAEHDGLTVRLTLKLGYDSAAARDEILLKREDIKVIVRKALMPRKIAHIITEPLRMEIRDGINAMFGSETVTDVEFLEFDPVL